MSSSRLPIVSLSSFKTNPKGTKPTKLDDDDDDERFIENQAQFLAAAMQSARDSGAFLFDQINRDDCLLQFSPWNEDTHPKFLEALVLEHSLFHSPESLSDPSSSSSSTC